jgi:hypothetical protein
MIKSRRMRWAGYVARMGFVNIGFGYALGDRGIGVWFPAGAKDLPLLHNMQTALGSIQPPIQWAPEALSSGVKRQGREAYHSPLSCTDVKNGGTILLLFHTSSW